MDLHDMARWQHKHHFHIDDRKGEQNTWRVIALFPSIVTDHPKTADHYKELLRDFEELAHVSLEINRCDSAVCVIAQDKIREQPSLSMIPETHTGDLPFLFGRIIILYIPYKCK